MSSDESAPWEELTPEEEEAMIEKIAKIVVSYGMDAPAKIFFETIQPVGTVAGATVMWMGAPFMEFLGLRGYSYSKLFMKRENLIKLIQRIDELRDREKIAEERKESKGERRSSMYSRLKSFFKG